MTHKWMFRVVPMAALAIAAAFVAKFAKIIAITAVVGLASLRKLFGGKNNSDTTREL